jgi:quercetin dioxygenase-like cupin family protein
MFKHLIPKILLLGLAVPLSAPLLAQDQAPHAKVTDLMTRPLPDFPGREAMMITVEFPPGGKDPVHRHDADAFIYVLQGSIVMGVQGQPEVTLKPGDSWYEGPHDIHSVGRNASMTQPAKFLVVALKKSGAPLTIPVH